MKTKYALLSESEYLQLNEAISKAKGYNLNNATARYSNPVPALAKVNITYVDEVESFDVVAVMEITAEVQINFPELVEGLTLVDSYVSAEASTTLEAIGLHTVTIDYTLNHIAKTGTSLEIVQLEGEPRSTASDVAVAQLVSEDVTIITEL